MKVGLWTNDHVGVKSSALPFFLPPLPPPPYSIPLMSAIGALELHTFMKQKTRCPHMRDASIDQQLLRVILGITAILVL